MKFDNQQLLKYIGACTSPYHTVDTSLQMLLDSGFTELSLENTWKLHPGSYVVNVFGTTLFAFHIGKHPRQTLRVASAHTDFPAIRVKPNPVVSVKGYKKLNVEMYGGLIENTWLDRPLGAAGTVVLKGESAFDVDSVLVDTKRPIAIIPNLAIHMNRTVNDGVKLNRQKDMLPILMMEKSGADNGTHNADSHVKALSTSDKDDKTIECYDEWMHFLADEVDCDPSEILSYEMTLYPVEQGCTLGIDGDFISSPRLDNLTSCFGVLSGIIEAHKNKVDGIRCAILFDNEEVGSRTKQGGAGMLLPNLVKRIYDVLGFTGQDMDEDLAKGFMISADVAHGLHPNYPEKNDITNIPVLNQGLALKMASSQSYAGDAKAIAIVKGLCEEADVQYQIYVNRSDVPGGSTVGSISSAMLPMRTMDIGLPILAMHSARETMGSADQNQLNHLMNYFLGDE
ncbi:M18 family aminopeptidase [Veillonella rodentium]|uniref:M18 family aminopeptidase n=1 Tax=Veillonella rodentium TaxID=248315 RepID=A0A239YU61_9FIRM|nr:M18 family aminopeptidase [Veillonella rodentium]SNV62619.1 Probable M18 family aminopeptidase 2 [Veillonella rodentium]